MEYRRHQRFGPDAVSPIPDIVRQYGFDAKLDDCLLSMKYAAAMRRGHTLFGDDFAEMQKLSSFTKKFMSVYDTDASARSYFDALYAQRSAQVMDQDRSRRASLEAETRIARAKEDLQSGLRTLLTERVPEHEIADLIREILKNTP